MQPKLSFVIKNILYTAYIEGEGVEGWGCWGWRRRYVHGGSMGNVRVGRFL